MPLNYDEGGIVTGWTPPATVTVRPLPVDPNRQYEVRCAVLHPPGYVCDYGKWRSDKEAAAQPKPPEPHHDLCICTVCWTRKQWQTPAGRWVSDKEWESDPVPPDGTERCPHGHIVMAGLICLACELAEQEALPKHEREEYQQVLTDALSQLAGAYLLVQDYASGSSLDIVILDAIQKAQDEIRWTQKCSRLAKERKDRDMQELIAKGPVHHLEPQALDTMRKFNNYDMALKRQACQAPYCSCVNYCTHDGRIMQAPGQLLTEQELEELNE